MKVDQLEAFGEGSRRQFQSMEMLRGLAALAVVLGHMTIFGQTVPTGSHMTPHCFLGNFLRCGTLGVDVFFCLSGFIITWIHAADIGLPSRAPRFLLRRFVRIYPSYLLLLLLKLVFYSWRGPGDSSVPLAERLFNSVFLIPFDMHQPDGSALIFAVAWTLSYEVFFYALFCFALILGPRFARNAALLWVVAIVLYHFSPHGSTGWRITDFIFSPFNLEFLAGIGAGLLAQRPWGDAARRGAACSARHSASSAASPAEYSAPSPASSLITAFFRRQCGVFSSACSCSAPRGSNGRSPSPSRRRSSSWARLPIRSICFTWIY